jgi:hypothetical protein
VQEPLDELMSFLSGALRRTAPIPDDEALRRACADHVAGNDRFTPAEQAELYREQFWLRHIAALREDYPALAHVIGDSAFDAFCEAYLVAFPPSSPSLRDLGHATVPFSVRYEGFAPDKRLLALDMVRYEHAMIDVFDGADPPPLDPQKIQGLPDSAWETARIVLHPLLVPMTLDYPVHTIRAAVRKGEAPALPDHAETVHVVLYRRDFKVCFEVLEPEAFQLLQALSEGEPLVPACNRIAAGLSDEAAARVAGSVGSWFQQWTLWGWIADVVV